MMSPNKRMLADPNPPEMAAVASVGMGADEGPHSRSAFMSLLASMLPASELRKLTTVEFEALIATLAGEVMSNEKIHSILKDRANEALRELKAI